MISLKGPTLGDTVVRVIFVALLLALVVQVAGARLGWWRAGVWKERAQESAADARQAQANADSANAGAENATTTRQAVDVIVHTVPAAAEASAQRIENHAPAAQPVAGPVDDDVLLELESAEAGARAAADRLQRKGSR
jgi:hypothetical protein